MSTATLKFSPTRFRLAFERSGVSKKHVALVLTNGSNDLRKINSHRNRIRRYMDGGITPSEVTIAKLADALGVRPVDLCDVVEADDV